MGIVELLWDCCVIWVSGFPLDMSSTDTIEATRQRAASRLGHQLNIYAHTVPEELVDQALQVGSGTYEIEISREPLPGFVRLGRYGGELVSSLWAKESKQFEIDKAHQDGGDSPRAQLKMPDFFPDDVLELYARVIVG